MKRIFASVCAAALLIVTGCSSSDDAEQVKIDWSESEIATHMGLQEGDAGWAFTTEAGEACTVDLILTSPADVQTHENAGNVVAVNTAGSAGVTIPGDTTKSCHDAAIDLLSDLE